MADETPKVGPLEPADESTLTVSLGMVQAQLTARPGDRFGRYKILEEIGQGGCGAVFVAEQEEPVRRRVALKVIKLGMDTRQVIARFEAERQALAMMEHPNIAKVFDAGSTDAGRPFFVMELVRGIKITDYCDQNKLSTSERLKLFIQVCQAVQHAHQKGIIHRDLKPSNILVTLHDGVPTPKVIDFGIAKATANQTLTDKTVYTAFEQFIGTPAYMSPEQAEMSGLDIDTRADIYSLGVLLYELLVGETPFSSEELLGVGLDAMRRILREKDPARPSTKLSTMTDADLTAIAQHRQSEPPRLINSIRGDLDWIVMKCLEKDRTRRYETANGLAMDIGRHLHDEPVIARPPSAVYRLQKAVSRNKLAFSAAGAVVCALILGITATTWQAVVATKARRDEAVARQGADQAARIAGLEKEQAIASEMTARQQAYASDMNLAQEALAANNLGRARELLYRQCPGANEPDLRGWEWRYLWQFCQSDALFKLCQKTNSIISLSVSRDGESLAIGEESEGGLSIWDLRTRQETKRLPAGKGQVRAVFSPSEPLLAFSAETALEATNYQCAVHLWNASSAREEGQIPLGNRCMGLAFSGDGQTLVVSTAGRKGEVSLWRVRNQQRIASYPAPQGFNFSEQIFAVTPDLSLAASGVNPINLLDLSTGRVRWSFHATNDFFSSMAFSPDAKVLIGAEGNVDTAIHLWDVVSGKEIIPARREHTAWVGQLLFSADGHTLVTASADETIRVWDASDHAHLAPRGRPFRGNRHEVWSLAMLPDQHTLVSGSKDGSVLLWDIAAPRNVHASVILPVKVNNWCFAADSKSVVTVDNKSHVARWQGEDFQDKRALVDVPIASIFSNDGRLLSSGSTNGTIRVWDLEGQTAPREFTNNTMPRFPMEFLPKAHKLVIWHADDHSLHLLDLVTGNEMTSWDVSTPSDFRALALSPDERWCILFGWGGASSLIEMATGRCQNPGFNLQQVSDAAFSPDGKLLAAASWKGLVRLWETKDWRAVSSLGGFLLSCESVVFSPDGTRLAMGGNGQDAIKLWNTSTYQELLTLPGSGSKFGLTSFSPDGNVLGSLNQSGLLLLWRAPSWEEITAAEAKERTEVQRP